MKPTLSLLLLSLTLTACDRPAPPPPGTSSPKAPAAGQPPTAPTPAPGAARTPPPVQAPIPTPGDDVGDLTSPTVTLSGVRLTWPQAWKRVAPANSIRLVELRVPDPAGNAADDCIATFSQAGGTVQWNLDRWKTQILDKDGKPQESKTDASDINGVRVHTFAATGLYQDGMPGASKTPRDNWTLRGAVLETTPNLTFIKMWGPAKAMTDADAAWKAMLQSVTRADAPAAAAPESPKTDPAPSK